ncbi:uncharacterized protein [Montipora capricornis]|uniref:uncharacterized protein n=1 Tax=Montipora capricornis TaxID=246305 RepID=UPI0035F16569
MRDVILLTGPDVNKVPRQGKRVWLMENGFMISGFELQKQWSECVVEACLREAFEEKIPIGVDFEILMPVHSTLVKPTLAPGQSLNGVMVHRVFKEKPIYIRPFQEICDDSICSIKRYRESSPNQEDDFIRHNPKDNEKADITCEQQDYSGNQSGQATQSGHTIQQQQAQAAWATQSSHTIQLQQAQPAQATNSVHTIQLQQVQPAWATQSDPTIQLQEAQIVEPTNNQDDAEDLIPMLYDDDAPKKCVTVHRSTMRKDLIEIFSDPSISNYLLDVNVIDANGHPEDGRGKGVLLDILTEFWQDFFTSLTVGSGEKIPFIRHDLQKPEWETIARILVYGYKTVKYFPLKLSHLFFASCLFGEESITPDFLLALFRQYIAAEDREVLDTCLSDAFDANDKDAIEFLSTFKCFRVPNKDNIRTIIMELAHQELVQKPRYVLNSWAPIVNSLGCDYTFQTLEGLKELYDSKRPTAKKINNLFRAESSSEAERQSLEHLKRFVKTLEGKAMAKFLHFCTGSDVITCDHIEVSFSSLEGFQRRPVVRTCIPMLELPTTYESYPALAEEFTNVMKEDQAWFFDMI